MKSKLVVLVMLVLSWSSLALASKLEPTVVKTVDGVSLKGVWTLPESSVRGVAVILPGSGNVGMDGDVSSPLIGKPHDAASAPLSAQLAEALATGGIASLRYDKRGVEDPSQLPNQIVSVLTKDARTALGLARARFPGRKLALVGVSEGAMISVALATTESVDALFLLSLPTRKIDESLHYQYLDWPLALLGSRLGFDARGTVALSELSARGLDSLPFAGLIPAVSRPLADYDLDHDGRLSLETELRPAYTTGFAQIMQLAQSPAYAAWYNDLMTLPAVRDLLPLVKTPAIYIYRAMDDAQLNPAWIDEDLPRRGSQLRVSSFTGLGHCFAPMEGSIGQGKTSGPLSADLLNVFSQDVGGSF